MRATTDLRMEQEAEQNPVYHIGGPGQEETRDVNDLQINISSFLLDWSSHELMENRHVDDLLFALKDKDESNRAKKSLVACEVHKKFDLMRETLYLTINIVDHYLSVSPIPRRELQLLSISELLISSKYEEIWLPEVNDLIHISCIHKRVDSSDGEGHSRPVRMLRNDLLKVNINLPLIFKIKLGNGQSTSFWHDPWIGGSPLEDSFPRLYRLDTNPNCNVFDRKPTDIVHVSSDYLVSFGHEDTTSPPGLLFQWAWRREPRTTPELEELGNLVSLLSQLHLTISKDTWECSIDDSRCFALKGMRSYITSMSPPDSYVATRWNRIVPLKININTWRVMNGRMATRSNLDRRVVDLDSVRCPLCNDGIEMKDHIFVHCKVTKELWSDVLKWWRIPNVSFPFLQDLVHLADHTPLGEKFTKFFDVVVQTTIWSIWRYKNNVIFSAKKPSKDLIFNDIKIFDSSPVKRKTVRRASTGYISLSLHTLDMEVLTGMLGGVMFTFYQSLQMTCWWAENPNGDEFRYHLAKVPDCLWIGEDGMTMNCFGSQAWDWSLSTQAFLLTNMETNMVIVSKRRTSI
ncbi:RNA-directed DNA polymerase, eukaryota, reverse transcriptase zinc-binding domain protein [Tanacetum coccineum]